MSIDLSLDRIKNLLSHLPTYTRPTIHIAGTNGKGSVSSIVSSILSASSIAVGRFNSPHLVSVRDSIVVNGKSVSSEAYTHALELVERADADHRVGASSFELLTATALLIFEHAALEVVVLEVGMGGRLDATNVIADACVLVSALTAVDLDHQAFLGDTVRAIATEKAGIARRGKPFVLGPQKYPDVVQAVREATARAGADLIIAPAVLKHVSDDSNARRALSFSPDVFQRPPAQPVLLAMAGFAEPVRVDLPLYGEHQLDNLAVAASVVDALHTHRSCAPRLSFPSRITPDTVAEGVKNTRWPGRLSFHDLPGSLDVEPRASRRRTVVLADGAHNPASSSTLASYISYLLARTIDRKVHLTFILGLSHSPPKTPAQTLTPLFSFERPANVEVDVSVAVLRFTPVDGMPWVRSVPPSELKATVTSLVPGVDLWSRPDEEDPMSGHVQQALQWAQEKHADGRNEGASLLILAGSLYLVADFYRWLQSENQ
ncbi:Mur ligase [Artomyces pyxidatus]|uniref:Mur ligase n=1 Tax=Artomyces pyxidatus TaxID=48021 RepID=A0ACB8T0I4_9AGAM|nr:Mur ligase [Artomyces pyxidatus]